VTGTFHVLTGEYPPQSGGVGDYTCLLAGELATRGCAVHVWCPTVTPEDHGGVHLHQLPDAFGPGSRRVIESALRSTPGCVLLQYVPNALGVRGGNLAFCLWLRRVRRGGADVRVMFHEPYFYFSWSPVGDLRAVVQRAMAATLLRASAVVYVSTATWIRYLRPWAPAGSTFVESPIPTTVPCDVAPEQIARWRSRLLNGDPAAVVVGHFGTFGEHVSQVLKNVIPVILHAHATARFVCIGRGSGGFAAGLGQDHPGLAERIEATGLIGARDVAAALRACDVVVQPYPDGVTTRRTSVMAALANGAATVSTDGPLTESVWRDARAVALAPASDPRALAAAVVTLLHDPDARAALATAGRRMYNEHFAMERTIEALLRAPVASV
jgi:glycosyltransferase involved in cell wall biosynthesis